VEGADGPADRYRRWSRAGPEEAFVGRTQSGTPATDRQASSDGTCDEEDGSLGLS